MSIIFTNNPYPFKHWMTSLAVGPLISFIYGGIYNPDFKINTDIIGMYLLYFAFGLAFSLPVFVLYLLIFNVLIKKTESEVIIKTTLNLVTIVSVFVIVNSIGGTAMTTTFSTIYSIGIILSSFFYNIKVKNTADT